MGLLQGLSLAVVLAMTLIALPARSETEKPAGDIEAERAAATAACADRNAYGPVQKAEAVSDGVGDWLVWVQDRDGDLWICNASAAGAVYANILIEGDLLRGKGGELTGTVEAADSRVEPAARAGELCMAVGGMVEEMTIVSTVADGMGDYLVWLKNADDALWMCNASGDAKLYAFEKVGAPLGGSSGQGGAAPDLRIAAEPRSVRI